MRLNEVPLLKKRYGQMLRVIQCIHLVLTLMILHKGLSSENPLDAINSGLFSNLGMAILMQVLIVMLRRGRVALAVGIHQVVTIAFLVSSALQFSGLASSTTASFHLTLLMFSLYLRQKHFVYFFIVVLASVVVIGLNEMFGWVITNSGSVGQPNVLPTLVIVFLYATFVSWILMQALRSAYKQQVQEQERIVEAKDQIQQLANTDQLTGLLNRYGAYNQFETLQQTAKSQQSSILLLFVDVDDFKTVNDQFGHHIGDEVLNRMGDRLRSVVGDDALISRLGGDEFVVALSVEHAFQADAFGDRVLFAVSQPLMVDGVSVEITCSIGITLSESVDVTFDELCRKADMAMYQAKTEGKDHCCQYHDGLEQAYMANLTLIKNLQTAIDNDSLKLRYQPKLDTSSQKVVGAEALFHWEQDNPAAYNNEQVFSVIETTNLALDVGYWVLKQACMDCKVWCETEASLPVSVNISPRLLADDLFATNVECILNEVGLPASLLTLEITEDALNQEGVDVVAQLKQVKALGVQLSVDRFGVGHSNLASLVDLQIDELKMDSGFVNKVTGSKKAQSIVFAFVKMADQMGMKLVAPRVERAEDSMTLSALGCVIGQGFLWSKPVSAQEFGQFIR